MLCRVIIVSLKKGPFIFLLVNCSRFLKQDRPFHTTIPVHGDGSPRIIQSHRTNCKMKVAIDYIYIPLFKWVELVPVPNTTIQPNSTLNLKIGDQLHSLQYNLPT